MDVFTSLHASLQEILGSDGISEPTAPQIEAIPKILEGKNILLIAPTGMGKTEAAVLPLFHKLLTASEATSGGAGKGASEDTSTKGIKILYITPLRALNRDMLARLKSWCDRLGISIAVRHGDTPQKERSRQARSPPSMLITTPETVQILFTGKRLREHLKFVEYVVVDEVHELSEDERGAQLALALERLAALKDGSEFQRIGLSATVGTPEELAKFLGGMGRDVEIIKVEIEKGMQINVESPEPTLADEELAPELHSEPKTIACIRRCRELIEEHRATLLFVNTRDNAEGIAARFRLWDESLPIGIHHGSLSKDVRIQMEDEFKAEQLKALICTSSLELGIDIGHADFSLQFNSPRQVTRLIQRVGRAGHRISEISRGTIIATNPDEIAEGTVIARRAMAGELEELVVRDSPLSVVANQLISTLMTSSPANAKDAYRIFRRAYPFKKLSFKKYESVLGQLFERNLVWLEDPEFGKRRGAMEYFYDNISMIPDEKTYRIVDITTRSVIGTLDERFVASYIEPYSRFIVKGISWRVVELEPEAVLVEPVHDIGALPSWIGEEIPVPFEVAQEVGRLRANFDTIADDYPMKEDARAQLGEYLADQSAKGFLIPSDVLITIEPTDTRPPAIIVNACFGSKVNETLGQLLSALIASKLGSSVGIRVDPYRIILELPEKIPLNHIQEHLLETKPDALEHLLRVILKNSSYLKWQMIQIARKFGAIRKEIDHTRVSLSKLLDSFIDTPLYYESIEKTIWDRMDLARTKDVLARIQNGEIKLEIGRLSPIGYAGYETRRELMIPERADRTILQAMQRRIEAEVVRLVCLHCGRTQRAVIKNLEDKFKCTICGSVMQAAVMPYDTDSIKLLKKKELTEEEAKIVKRLRKNANLVMEHGKRAVTALAARGIGPDKAARILAKQYLDDIEFLREILKAEITYARTKRFWD
ncbi:MAG: DEAD/DEAH box helicase [Thermoplasmata archaeon]|nr:MAG: DEAD/DEAH box helicase [Thermoplasmata archaeon]